jgi:DNA-binding response OmpR family regulator
MALTKGDLMSGDLLTLRMIVVSALDGVRELWQEGVILASVPIEFSVCDSAVAAAKLAKDNADIVILDAALATADRDAVIKAARAAKPQPLIALSALPGTDRVEGVDSIFPKPANAADVHALVERCIRTRLPKRVLIVDDSKTMRSIVRKILSASRFALDVSEAEEGAGALSKIAGGYDVVLLDYNMPGFNGIETLAEIKRVAPHVVVVLMTSTEDEAIAGRAQASGAVAFLKKPFYPADIDTVLEYVYDLAGREPPK